MMRDGLIRTIVTLNFDLLIETAVRELGVEPTVVSTVDDVRGMEPLHAQRNLVWHLHGDYTNPEMLNTPDELREYAPVVNDRLDELFDQYGLIVVGWSATWDPALRAAISRCSSRRYPTSWLSRSELSDEARRLATQRDAVVVQDTADVWLKRLADACVAIRQRSKEPLTTVSSIAALKRELSRNTHSISAHDRMQAEIERIARLPVMDTRALDSMVYVQRLPVLEAELETWTALVGTRAYWGDTETDEWWTRYIDQFGAMPRLGGTLDAIESFRSPAEVSMFAGGAAAAAAGRWGTVCELLVGHSIQDVLHGGRQPASALLGPGTMYQSDVWPSRRLAGYVGPILASTVGMGTIPALDGWERFEYLCWIINVDRNQRGVEHTLAWPTPYLRVDDDRSGGRRETSPLASTWLAESSSVRSLVLERLFDGDADRLDVAINEGDDSVSVQVDRFETQTLLRPGVRSWMPSGVRRAMVPKDTDPPTWPA